MASRYKKGDKFAAKGCREYGLLELKDIITENNKTFFILEEPRNKHIYKVSENNINTFYYREN